MGMAYLVDKEPVFLTFENYGRVLRAMEKLGLKSTDPSESFAAEMGGKARIDLDKKIVSFLRTNKEIVDSGKFDLQGKEAQAEISSLLDAYRWAYGGFDFYQFVYTDNTPSGSFVPIQYAGIDLAHPFGERFCISKVSKKSFFHKKNEPQVHILIDTKKVAYVKGDLSLFEIGFVDNKKMLFAKHHFCVL